MIANENDDNHHVAIGLFAVTIGELVQFMRTREQYYSEVLKWATLIKNYDESKLKCLAKLFANNAHLVSIPDKDYYEDNFDLAMKNLVNYKLSYEVCVFGVGSAVAAFYGDNKITQVVQDVYNAALDFVGLSGHEDA